MSWFNWLFSNAGFMPRAICGIWTPGMIFLHNASDFLIWTAFIAIPLVLIKFAYSKRCDLPFRGLFWLFGLFILACGTTHFMDIVMFYNPLYRLAGVIKLVTAAASWGTVGALFYVAPVALQMRSAEVLEHEIEQRKRAEAEVQQVNEKLETLVQERTAHLEAASAGLQSSEASFRLLTEVMPQIVWTSRPDGFLDYYNGHWSEYTGMTIEQTQGWGWQPVLHPDDVEKTVAVWKHSVESGEPYEVEYRFKRASDGTYRWHLGRAMPLRDEQGNITKWFGTCTDIDDQKRAQQELQRSQIELEALVQERTLELSQANAEQQRLLDELERSNTELESRVRRRTLALEARTQELHSSLSLLTATIESTSDGIVVMDFVGSAISLNTRFSAIWGYPEELLQRRDADELRAYTAKQLKNPERFFEIVKRHLASPEKETFDVIELKDGRTFERYGFPQRVNQECVGVVVNFRDITQRKQAEAEREELLAKEHEAREEAERANAAKDEFLSRMSHELRTPLNAILGFGQILEMRQQHFTAPDNDSVQQILKAGRHQLELVNEVLDITRINAPDSALSLEPLALNEVVDEALAMLQSLASPGGIALSQQLDPLSPIFVLADRQRLLQILLNLLSNAIKYNTLKGQVTVSAEVLPENRLCLHISDTGHGIAPEDLPKLFVPFSRLNAPRLGVEGTGLGLVLCQRLVTAMNGSLHVESQQGRGSTFSVELPLASPPSSLRPAESIPSPPVVEKPVTPSIQHTVLLIEDNISNFQLIERILDNFSQVRLLGAMQGALGVELALHHQPDLILLDLHLPDIMGDEVLRRLQSAPETRNIPVIILSADATPSQIHHLLDLGAYQYLTKPLDIEPFLRAVNEVLHHQSDSRFESATSTASRRGSGAPQLQGLTYK